MNVAKEDLPQDRQIVLHVGINLGNVMVEGSDLYGDGLNIATRLEAWPSPAAFSYPTVFIHVRGKGQFDFEDRFDWAMTGVQHEFVWCSFTAHCSPTGDP
jgi:adenylate cyclase